MTESASNDFSRKSNSIEDIFNSSFNLVDSHLKEGYDKGYADSLVSRKEEGRQLGLKIGFEVGEKWGFYRGCIDVWNSVIGIDPIFFSSRVVKNIKQMEDLLNKYPVSNLEDVSVGDLMDSLRLKVKAICATLNYKLEYNGYPKACDGKKVEF